MTEKRINDWWILWRMCRYRHVVDASDICLEAMTWSESATPQVIKCSIGTCPIWAGLERVPKSARELGRVERKGHPTDNTGAPEEAVTGLGQIETVPIDLRGVKPDAYKFTVEKVDGQTIDEIADDIRQAIQTPPDPDTYKDDGKDES